MIGNGSGKCNYPNDLLASHVQFALLESPSVDADLANLKNELSGSSKVIILMP